MKTTKVIMFVVWLIIAFSAIDESYSLINKSLTIANIAGVFLLVAIVLVSIKTKCFTSINIKLTNKKDESNEK